MKSSQQGQIAIPSHPPLCTAAAVFFSIFMTSPCPVGIGSLGTLNGLIKIGCGRSRTTAERSAFSRREKAVEQAARVTDALFVCLLHPGAVHMHQTRERRLA